MRARARLLLLLLVLCAATTLVSCRKNASPQGATASPLVATGYNLLMISINNVSAQHMSLYGYKRKTTPRLEEFAKDALVFDEAYTPCSWTLPGATSVMTSMQPYSHRVMDRWESNLLNAAIPVLPEYLRDQGYATVAFTGGLDYRPTFGHLRGVTDSSFNLDFSRFSTSLKQAEKWLSYNGSKRFCMVLQGYDAHPPFRPPAPYKGTYSGGKRPNVHVSTDYAVRGYKDGDKYVASYIWQESDPKKRQMLDIAYPPEKRTIVLTKEDIDYLQDLYDDSVLSVDGQVAEFLSHIDPQVMARTVVVIFSEHGEMFARHGRFGRAGTVRGNLYDDVMRVPLIIKIPNGPKGRISGLAQLIDIAPTLLEILGIAPPPTFQGKSLMPLTRGETEVNDYVFAGAEYNQGRGGRSQPFFQEASTGESIRNHKWKLVHEKLFVDGKPPTESWELYDLKSDPGENANLLSSYTAVAENLKKLLATWAEAGREFMKDKPPTTMEFPPDFEEKARAHGYW